SCSRACLGGIICGLVAAAGDRSVTTRELSTSLFNHENVIRRRQRSMLSRRCWYISIPDKESNMNRTETYQDYLQLVVTDLNGRGVGYSEVSEHYSFRSAYDDGLSAA